MTNYIVNNMSKSDKKKLAICVAIPLVVGVLSAFATKNQMASFELVNKPPLSPPGWVFPVMWSILYILMGVASFLVLSSTVYKTKIDKALMIYGVQLAVNFSWSILFFRFRLLGIAAAVAIILLLLTGVMILAFKRVKKISAWMNIPYLIWLCFASYLAAAVYILN